MATCFKFLEAHRRGKERTKDNLQLSGSRDRILGGCTIYQDGEVQDGEGKIWSWGWGIIGSGVAPAHHASLHIFF